MGRMGREPVEAGFFTGPAGLLSGPMADVFLDNHYIWSKKKGYIMDYQGKYTGAELEALLDKIGKEPYVEVSFSFDECGVTTTKEVSLADIDNVPVSGDFYLNVFIKIASMVFSQARLLCHRDVSGVITSDGTNSQAYQPDGSLRVTFISGINEAGTGVIVTSYPRYDLVFIDNETAIIPDIGMNANVRCPRSVIDNAGAVMVIVEEDIPPSEDISFLCNLCCVNDGITVNGRTTVYIEGKGLVEVSASYNDEREFIVVSSRYVNAGGQPQAPEPYVKVTMTPGELVDGGRKEILFSGIENIPASGDFWLNVVISNGYANVCEARLSCHKDESGTFTVDHYVPFAYNREESYLVSFNISPNEAGTGIIVLSFSGMTEPYRCDEVDIFEVGTDGTVPCYKEYLLNAYAVRMNVSLRGEFIGVLLCDVLVDSSGNVEAKGKMVADTGSGLVSLSCSYDNAREEFVVSSRSITTS